MSGLTLTVGFSVAGLCLTGCGGTDEGRLQGDSYEVPSGNLVGCDLAASLDLTLVSGGGFESGVAQWGTRYDGTTSADGAKLACSQDSSKPCAAESTTGEDITGVLGGSVYTGELATYAAPLPACNLAGRGAHIRGEGLKIWGGQFYRNFSSNPDAPTPVDASGYDGIAFWAKLGQKNVGTAVFVAFEDRYTRENSTVVDETTGVEAAYCLDSPIDAEKCDRFGAGVGLESNWRYIKVPFAQVQQRGYGKASARLHTEELLGVTVYFDVGDWDFWVDEISFYKEKG